jgi:hypothetical protein
LTRKFIIAVCLLAFGLAGCGGGVTIHEGTVTDRVYDPAHEESYLAQQYAGEDCTYSNATKAESCTPRYIWVTRYRWVDDSWSLKVVNCHVRDKNGNDILKKDGTPKCFKRWYDVDQTTYHNYPKGKWYKDEKAGEPSNA